MRSLWILLVSAGVLGQDPGLARFQEFVKPYDADLSGVFLAARSDRVLWRHLRGMASFELEDPLRPETAFYVGSVSKQFTAAAVLKLAESGELSIQDPLAKYLPQFPKTITLAHLLSHTSGVVRESTAEWKHESRVVDMVSLVNYIAEQPLQFEPGSREAYSNAGYLLLARVIEVVSGKTYADWMRIHLFKPLGLKHTGVAGGDLVTNMATGHDPGPGGVVPSPYWYPLVKTGNGNIYSTVGDLFRWTRALHSGKVLGRRYYQMMVTAPEVGRPFGMGLYKRAGRTVVGHDGVLSGFNASLEYFPDEKVTLVYLGNIRSGTLSIVANAMAAAVFKTPFEGYQPPPQIEPQPPASADFVGDYQLFPGFNLSVSQRGDNLYLLGTGGYPTVLYPCGRETWFYRAMYARIRFEDLQETGYAKLVWIGTDGTPYPATRR